MKKDPPWKRRQIAKRAIKNCQKKRVFKTVDEAASYSARFKGNMRVYPCRICGHYHLTTNHDEK